MIGSVTVSRSNLIPFDPNLESKLRCQIPVSNDDLKEYKECINFATKKIKEISIDDIVWARLDDFPWWPAVVVGITENKILVRWCLVKSLFCFSLI